MKNYGDVETMMGEFLHSIEAEKAIAKQAAEAPTPGPNDEAKTSPEGKTSETVASAQAAEGAAGKEKQQDLVASTPGILADTAAATNTNGDGKEPTDDQGPKTLDASQVVTDNVTVETTPEKIARAGRLGDAILRTVAELQKAAAQEDSAVAPAAPVVEPTLIEKIAAEDPMMADSIAQAYQEFTTGWLAGYNQRNQDKAEMLESGIFKTAEDADAVLDMVAAEDPGAIAPPGLEVPAAPASAPDDTPAEIPADANAAPDSGDLDPETEAQLNELADQMSAAGVSPEDIVQAAAQLEELTNAGVSPEEIIQAAGEIQDEDAAAAPDGAPDAPAADIPPEDAEKIAAERKSIIKDYIRGLNQA